MEPNWQPYGMWDYAQPIEPHGPELKNLILLVISELSGEIWIICIAFILPFKKFPDS